MSWQTIFINPQRHRLRSGWRVSVFFLILVTLREVFGLIFAFMITGGDLTQASNRMATPLGFTGLYLSLTLAALIASVVCLRAFDRRPLRSIGYALRAGWWRDYLIGAGVAAVMLTAVVGIQWLAGGLSLQWSRASASDLLNGLVVSFVFFTIAAAFEELTFRGYPLQTLLRDVSPAWAVIITSTLFGVAHSPNPHTSALGLLNTVLAGIWLAVAYLKTRNLWLCTSLHWSWNWTMSAIYGLAVSGLEGVVKTSCFGAQQTGPDWLTGGRYGPEGSLLVTVVVSLGTMILWRARWLAPSQNLLVGPASGIEDRVTNHASRTMDW